MLITLDLSTDEFIEEIKLMNELCLEPLVEKQYEYEKGKWVVLIRLNNTQPLSDFLDEEESKNIT